jgi:hypothetical protein
MPSGRKAFQAGNSNTDDDVRNRARVLFIHIYHQHSSRSRKDGVEPTNNAAERAFRTDVQ